MGSRAHHLAVTERGQLVQAVRAPANRSSFSFCVWLINLISALRCSVFLVMNLDQVIRAVEKCSEQMNVKYGDVVFDEWLIVHMGKTDKILAHSGPRGEEIVLDFGTDTEAVHKVLRSNSNSVGDFGFTNEGFGTGFDAYTVIGKNLFVLWNRTAGETTQIIQHRRWPMAKTELTAFAEAVKKDPVQYSE